MIQEHLMYNIIVINLTLITLTSKLEFAGCGYGLIRQWGTFGIFEFLVVQSSSSSCLLSSSKSVAESRLDTKSFESEKVGWKCGEMFLGIECNYVVCKVNYVRLFI